MGIRSRENASELSELQTIGGAPKEISLKWGCSIGHNAKTV